MPASTIHSKRRRIFRTPFIAIALTALLMCGTARRAAAVELNAEEQHLASRLTGDQGQRRDRSRMHLDPILTAVARARAEDMAHRRYFSHVNPDGLGPNFLVRAAGYALPSAWGGRSGNFIESIGAGYATAEAAWEGWMHSSSHRTHLLASSSFYRDQTNFGIGTYTDPSSPYRRYWVIITAPPSSHGEDAFVSRHSAKPARIAGLMPVLSDVDPDEGRIIDWESEQHLGAPRPAAAEKLWNSDGPEPASRPPAPRIIGAG
ncbi:MAG: CAP domain-containing protein [Chthoniobacteraceae bacterium]